MKRKYKFKWLFGILFFFVICVCIIAFVFWYGQRNMTLDELLQSYTKDYTIEEQLEDGRVAISFEAPDFSVLIQKMSEDFNYQDISVPDLANMIKENPDLVKEYNIFVEKLDEESIENAFSSQIAYELLIQAIKGSKETERK